MRTRLLLIAAIISLLVFNRAKAQTDSTHYDLGRLLVNKNFTQSITVKASDLERYQFNYITDALNVFFYGTFTNSSSVVYVIDGNIVNDIDSYSIQDIEEITLVQSAAGQVNGAGPGQQLILIKTRRGGPGKQGVIASNQTSLVNARNNNNYNNAEKPTGIYEQAYVGAYKNYTNADIGISADYLHNVSPEDYPSTVTTFNPFHYNQLKLNAYADTKLWKGSTLSFSANYTTELPNESYTENFTTPNSQAILEGASHESQQLFNTTVSLHSHIAGGLTNTLSAGYNHYHDYEQGATVESINEEDNQTNTFSTQFWQRHTHTLLFKDNLAYHQQIGDWSIDPSVNFMYRHVNDTLSFIEAAYQDSITTGGYQQASAQKSDYKLSLLTPSLNIYYKNIFDIQGGFVSILNKENIGTNYPVQRVLPFVSASLNISEMTGMQAIKLNVFGSFSRHNEFLDDPYVSLQEFALQGFENPVGYVNTTAETIAFTNYNVYQSYNNYQAGFLLGLSKNFSISYNFRENYEPALIEYLVPEGANGVELEDAYQGAKLTTNRLALNYDFHFGNFNWMTGLNATESKLQLTDPGLASAANTYLGDGHRWTGGFNNRFTYGNLFAGLNILYQVGQRPYSLEHWQSGDPDYIPPSNTNSFSLQNLYIGTRVKFSHLKYAEVYINTRNILQNNSSDITDERRFYGFGFKLGL